MNKIHFCSELLQRSPVPALLQRTFAANFCSVGEKWFVHVIEQCKITLQLENTRGHTITPLHNHDDHLT
jgi:hypothetical protein